MKNESSMPGLTSFAKTVLPYSVRHALRFAYSRTIHSRRIRGFVDDVKDGLDAVRGRLDPLKPPRKLLAGTGGGAEVAERFLGYFREWGGLDPTDTVLDVGSGVGRMALPLTRFLSPPGRYEGFDIIRANVNWCTSAITPRFPHFHFQHANLFNREYNRRGTETGDRFRFPYDDATFNFSFLTSVFTHLMPGEVENYFRELARVLKPGGRVLATFFLLNDESTALVDAGQSKMTLYPPKGVYRVHNEHVPEMCIAYDETFIEWAASAAGLRFERPVRYGLWCGRENWVDFQDIVILTK